VQGLVIGGACSWITRRSSKNIHDALLCCDDGIGDVRKERREISIIGFAQSIANLPTVFTFEGGYAVNLLEEFQRWVG